MLNEKISRNAKAELNEKANERCYMTDFNICLIKKKSEIETKWEILISENYFPRALVLSGLRTNMIAQIKYECEMSVLSIALIIPFFLGGGGGGQRQ